MTVSELIKELQAIEPEHGDKPVNLYITTDAGSLLAEATEVKDATATKISVWIKSSHWDVEKAK